MIKKNSNLEKSYTCTFLLKVKTYIYLKRLYK